MKIALFSDIHANLPALQAFFEDLETKEIDSIYCLGDLVGYNMWPNEVVNEIRKRKIPCIAGNYDFGIGRNINDCGCAYKTAEDKANGAVSIKLTNSLIGPSERNYLRTLPSHINLEFKLKDEESINLLLVHGSPRKINEYLFEDRPEASLLRIMNEAKADILCFGHTHKPYHRILQENSEYKHAINIGSIGKPKDANPLGGYVVITIDETLNLTDKNTVKVDFVRFAYDVEKAANAIENSELPNAFAQSLRTGV